MTSVNGALMPPDSDEWIAVSAGTPPVDAARQWATVAACGGVVTFRGTVRDHSAGRPAVSNLEYEAYQEYVVPKMAAVASPARRQWPELGCVALLHRVGILGVGEVAVAGVVTDIADVGTAVEFYVRVNSELELRARTAAPLPMSVGGICTVEVSACAVQVWTVDVQSG